MRSADDRDDAAPGGALLAIDAALRGEPADPEYAELAELALLLRDERPACPPPVAASLDARFARRFAPETPPAARARRRWWGGVAAWSAAGSVVVAGLLVVVVLAGGGGGSSSSNLSVAAPAISSSSSAAGALGSGAAASAAGRSAPHSALSRDLRKAASTPSSAASGVPSTIAAPVPNSHRQIVQEAQLQLSTGPTRISQVAQEVFNAVADQQGIVEHSSVTATGQLDGGAFFQLRIPSANLAAALTQLSRLPWANVISRADATSDITGQVGGAGMRLAEARALRRSLLRQLAAATTTTQVDAIKAQLHDADAAIASDLSTLNGLHAQVAYSLVQVSIQAVAPPVHHHSAGGPFSLGRAWHDAGRVLVVVAGVGLIALAVLLPVGLVAAVLAWVGLAVRRRRREHALDML